MRRRRPSALPWCLVISLLAVVLLAPGASAQDAQAWLTVEKDRFDKDAVNVTLGDRVVFRNLDAVTRRFVADEGRVDSGPVGPEEVWTFRPNRTGTYAFHDRLQPEVSVLVHVLSPRDAFDRDGDAGPRVRFTHPAPNETVRDGLTVRGLAAAGNGTVERVAVRVDGGPWFDAEGTTEWRYRLDTHALENGEHLLEARAFTNGDWTNATRLTFLVENHPPLPPVATLTAPEANATVDAATLIVRGESGDPNGDPVHVTVRLAGETSWMPADREPDGAWQTVIDLTNVRAGRHVLEVRATDGTHEAALERLVYVDREPPAPPTVRAVSHARGATVNGTVELQVTVEGGSGGPYEMSWRPGRGPWMPMTAVEGVPGLFTATWDTEAAAGGVVRVAFRAEDRHGHTTLEHPLLVDNPGSTVDAQSDFMRNPPVPARNPVELPDQGAPELGLWAAVGAVGVVAVAALALTRLRKK